MKTDLAPIAIFTYNRLDYLKILIQSLKKNFLCSNSVVYFFSDKWKNLSIDGVSISDVTQKFVPKSFSSGYSFGENPKETQSYVIQFSGIKQNEKIIRGELKKILIELKSIEQQKTILFDDVYYRIFIKEGKTNVVVFDWTKTDVTNENSFYLDTSYLIPREYYMEFKSKTYTEEVFYNNYVKFEILSER